MCSGLAVIPCPSIRLNRELLDAQVDIARVSSELAAIAVRYSQPLPPLAVNEDGSENGGAMLTSSQASGCRRSDRVDHLSIGCEWLGAVYSITC